MAKTELHKYTVAEKLNKMDVDLIDISITGLHADAHALNDLMFQPVEIPNAVAVPGGTAILQSAVAIITGHSTEASANGANATGSFNIVVTSDSTDMIDGSGTQALNDSMGDNTTLASVYDGICGTTTISNIIDGGYNAIGSKQNIGMVCKAASGSTSLHVFGIAQSTNDYNGGSIILRLGFVKD